MEEAGIPDLSAIVVVSSLSQMALCNSQTPCPKSSS